MGIILGSCLVDLVQTGAVKSMVNRCEVTNTKALLALGCLQPPRLTGLLLRHNAMALLMRKKVPFTLAKWTTLLHGGR